MRKTGKVKTMSELIGTIVILVGITTILCLLNNAGK